MLRGNIPLRAEKLGPGRLAVGDTAGWQSCAIAFSLRFEHCLPAEMGSLLGARSIDKVASGSFAKTSLKLKMGSFGNFL